MAQGPEKVPVWAVAANRPLSNWQSRSFLFQVSRKRSVRRCGPMLRPWSLCRPRRIDRVVLDVMLATMEDVNGTIRTGQ